MNVTESNATISLSISDYFGPSYLESGVSIIVEEHLVNRNGMPYSFTVDHPAMHSDSYTWNLTPDQEGAKFVSITCDFYYMGKMVTSHTVQAG